MQHGGPVALLDGCLPNHPPVYEEFFDLERVSSSNREKWKAGLMWFLKCLTVRESKRIVLKSPPHTFRIEALMEMFPERGSCTWCAIHTSFSPRPYTFGNVFIARTACRLPATKGWRSTSFDA